MKKSTRQYKYKLHDIILYSSSDSTGIKTARICKVDFDNPNLPYLVEAGELKSGQFYPTSTPFLRCAWVGQNWIIRRYSPPLYQKLYYLFKPQYETVAIEAIDLKKYQKKAIAAISFQVEVEPASYCLTLHKSDTLDINLPEDELEDEDEWF